MLRRDEPERRSALAHAVRTIEDGDPEVRSEIRIGDADADAHCPAHDRLGARQHPRPVFLRLYRGAAAVERTPRPTRSPLPEELLHLAGDVPSGIGEAAAGHLAGDG